MVGQWLRGRGPRLSLLIVAALFAVGCQTLGFYGQAVSGQLGLLNERRPVADLLAELDTAPEPQAAHLRQRLLVSQQVLEYAEQELGIAVGERYRTYVALKTPNVLWNVFAAPSLALEPRRWCYPFAGCAPYRGYFDESDARSYAARLRARGDDAYVGGVAAYSTLGWFADPLLSSFIDWPDADLAQLLLHELAHSKVWVKGDVGFNEAFATFVGRTGMVRWLAATGRQAGLAEYEARRGAWRSMLALLQETRAALQVVYGWARPEADRLAGKALVLALARSCYRQHIDRYGGGHYDVVMRDLNNAYLVSLATYQDQVPAFAALFAGENESWEKFFAAATQLAELDPADRAAQLQRLAQYQQTGQGNDDGADEVQCEALASHGLDGEASG